MWCNTRSHPLLEMWLEWPSGWKMGQLRSQVSPPLAGLEAHPARLAPSVLVCVLVHCLSVSLWAVAPRGQGPCLSLRINSWCPAGVQSISAGCLWPWSPWCCGDAGRDGHGLARSRGAGFGRIDGAEVRLQWAEGGSGAKPQPRLHPSVIASRSLFPRQQPPSLRSVEAPPPPREGL